MRGTVNTKGAGTTDINIRRCTANCTTGVPTWSQIYSTNLSLSTNATASKGSAPNQNFTTLVSGDQFRAEIVSNTGNAADITVNMTCTNN